MIISNEINASFWLGSLPPLVRTTSCNAVFLIFAFYTRFHSVIINPSNKKGQFPDPLFNPHRFSFFKSFLTHTILDNSSIIDSGKIRARDRFVIYVEDSILCSVLYVAT